MKVLKFGGSSVAKPARIRGIINILKDYYAAGDQFTVVFSAFGGVTDSLISMGRLAAAGDDNYGETFQAFADRHQAAIDDLDGKDLDGRNLTVNEARPRQPRPGGGGGGGGYGGGGGGGYGGGGGGRDRW